MEENQSYPSDSQTEEHIEKKIDGYRDDLLDFTRRNPLLNFFGSKANVLQFSDEYCVDDIYYSLERQDEKEGLELRPKINPETNMIVCPESKPDLLSIESCEQEPTEKISNPRLPAPLPPNQSLILPGNNQELKQLRFLNTTLPQQKYEKLLDKLKKEAQRRYEETGNHSLQLALGFLGYHSRKNPETDDPQLDWSPILLMPVTLTSQSTPQGRRYFLRKAEDVADNDTLGRLLQRDFGLCLPLWEENDSDARPAPDTLLRQIEETLRLAGQGYAKWSIARQSALRLINFSSMRLIQDLEHAKVRGHPLVRRLMAGMTGPTKRIPEQDLDAIVTGSSNTSSSGQESRLPPIIFDADSSQHSALIHALQNREPDAGIVIDGPPGTGKSQTIANLIAAALSEGKSVLFVSQKMAALDVVSKKLDDAGLGDFCVRLHSKDARVLDFVAGLRRRLDLDRAEEGDLLSGLEPHEKELNGRDPEALLQTYWQQLAAIPKRQNQRTLEGKGPEIWKRLWGVQRYRQDPDLSAFRARGPRLALNVIEGLPRDRVETLLSKLADSFQAHHAEQGDAPTDLADLAGLSPLPAAEPAATRPQDLAPCLESIQKHAENLLKVLTALADTPVLDGAMDGQTGFTFGQAAQLATLLGLVPLPDPDIDWPLTRWLHGHRQTPATADGDLIASILDAHRDLEEGKRLAAPLLDLWLERSLEDYQQALQQLDSYRKLPDAAASVESLPISTTREDPLAGLLEAAKEMAELLARPAETREEIRELHDSAREILDHPALGPLVEKLAGQDQSEAMVDKILKLVPHTKAALLSERGIKIVRNGEWSKTKEDLQTLIKGIKSAFPKGTKTINIKIRNTPDKFRKGLSGLLLNAEDHNLQDFVDAINAARRALRILADLDSDANLKNCLGDHYQGLATDFPLLEQAQAWLPVAKAAGPGWLGQVRMAAEGLVAALERAEQDVAFTAVPTQSPLKQVLQDRREQQRQGWLLRQALLACGLDCDRPHPLADLRKVLRAAHQGRKGRDKLDAHEEAGAPPLDRPGLSRIVDIGQDWLDRLLRLPPRDRSRIEEALMGSNGADLLARIMAQKEPLSQAVTGLRNAYAELEGLVIFDPKSWFEAVGHGPDTWGQPPALEQVALVDHGRRAERAARAVRLGWFGTQVRYADCRGEAEQAGLGDLVAALEDGVLAAEKLIPAFDWLAAEARAEALFEHDPDLAEVNPPDLAVLVRTFQETDKEALKVARRSVRQALLGRSIPEGHGGAQTGAMTERTLLEKLSTQKQPRLSIRKILSKAGNAVQALKPCFLMGPLGVAQYLDPEGITFDLVVMDEASQMPPEEALGATARGRRLVVVGDDKQMPPSGIFKKVIRDQEDDEDEEYDDPHESILELCQPLFPTRRLRWHYRSQHEGLIRFSNHCFYDNELIVFPSASNQGGDGLHWHPVQGGCFAKGPENKGRNEREAEQVKVELQEIILQEYQRDRPRSVGIVAMNRAQTDLIEELWARRLDADDPEAKQMRDVMRTLEEQGAPLFIKNLENVQGDERDIILLSMTYGPGPDGKVSQRFGPLGGKEGRRRLNVAITRARCQLHVVSSLEPGQLRLLESDSRASIAALQDFLAYARDGVLPARGEETEREPDSDFEQDVGKVLEREGWEVVYQLGVRPYYIDIAVRHPEQRDRFILAIECDGAAYHSHKSARDRDRLRQERLEAMGWRVYRIWSTDWFQHQEEAIRKMLEEVRNAASEAKRGYGKDD